MQGFSFQGQMSTSKVHLDPSGEQGGERPSFAGRRESCVQRLPSVAVRDPLKPWARAGLEQPSLAHLNRNEKKSLLSQQPGAWVKETASHAAEATSAPLPWGEKSEVPPQNPGLALGHPQPLVMQP